MDARTETTDELTHRVLPTRSKTDEAVSRGFAIAAARMLHDDRCEDVTVLDVRRLSQVCDFLVIASGTSDRQMRSAADDVEEVGEETGMPVLRRNQDDRTTWVVLDCLDVVVHVFEPETRALYDLEMLWGDAKRVPWRRPESERAGRRAADPGKGG